MSKLFFVLSMLFCVVLPGCAKVAAPTPYANAAEMKAYMATLKNYYTPENFATMYEIVRRAFHVKTGVLPARKAFGSINSIQFYSGPFPCNHVGDGTCVGEIKYKYGIGGMGNIESVDIYLTVRPCLPESSLAHELTHMLAGIYEGGLDESHTNPLLWGPEGVVALANAAGEMVPDMCPVEL